MRNVCKGEGESLCLSSAYTAELLLSKQRQLCLLCHSLVRQFTNHHHPPGIRVKSKFSGKQSCPPPSLPPNLNISSLLPPLPLSNLLPQFLLDKLPSTPSLSNSLLFRVPFPRFPSAALTFPCQSQPLPAAHTAVAWTNCLSPVALIHGSRLCC